MENLKCRVTAVAILIFYTSHIFQPCKLEPVFLDSTSQ